jgi:hypothetical protein
MTNSDAPGERRNALECRECMPVEPGVAVTRGRRLFRPAALPRISAPIATTKSVEHGDDGDAAEIAAQRLITPPASRLCATGEGLTKSACRPSPRIDGPSFKMKKRLSSAKERAKASEAMPLIPLRTPWSASR